MKKPMTKRVRRLIQSIIDKEYLTDWEFIIERIAPELEQEEFEGYEHDIAEMIEEEISDRKLKLYSNTK